MKNFIFLIFVLALLSCKDSQSPDFETFEKNFKTNQTLVNKSHLGKTILEQECYNCHDPKASMTNRIAPPMEAVKRHYIDSSITKEEFTEALIRWVDDPETEKKMPGAHKRFGPMPYMPKPVDAITLIAEYIYEYELERPDWFDAHFQKEHKKGMVACKYFKIQEPEID